MSIRRWLRRWFGEPEPDCDCNFCVTGERDGFGHDDGEPTHYDGQHDDCIATTAHWHDRPYRRGQWAATFDDGWAFRDTGSGDRDTGVDALVERS